MAVVQVEDGALLDRAGVGEDGESKMVDLRWFLEITGFLLTGWCRRQRGRKKSRRLEERGGGAIC